MSNVQPKDGRVFADGSVVVGRFVSAAADVYYGISACSRHVESVGVGSSTTGELVALRLGLSAVRDHVLAGEMSLGACSGVHIFIDSHVAI